jgi:hypothetical protein
VKDLPKRKQAVTRDEATQVKGGGRERPTPSVNEIVVTKISDVASHSLG